MIRALVVLASVLAPLVARDAVAGVPTDQLRGSIDLVLKIVTDPELKKEAKTAERRKRIRTVVNQIFDFQRDLPAVPRPALAGAHARREGAIHRAVRRPPRYRMFLKDGRWAVYDVSIEGISLIGNYRTQFNAVIQRSGYPDLVAKLTAKRDERPGAREAGRQEAAAPASAAPLPPRQSP